MRSKVKENRANSAVVKFRRVAEVLTFGALAVFAALLLNGSPVSAASGGNCLQADSNRQEHQTHVCSK
jgi:hypothetical protein